MACPRHISPALLFLWISLCPMHLPAREAVEIIERMENAMRGESSQAAMTMVIERSRYRREISLRYWLKGRRYSMIAITAPARDQGTAYLMRDNEIWNYDPRIERTTRLPSSMMAQSWMGSDFTNDDLVRDSNVVDDYEHEIIAIETYRDRRCYLVEMIPRPDTPVVWGKVRMWIDTEDYLQLKIENYDQQGALVNTMKLDQIRKLHDREIPTRITVIPADRDDHRTILEYQSLQFNVDLQESFFTRANMQRLR